MENGCALYDRNGGCGNDKAIADYYGASLASPGIDRLSNFHQTERKENAVEEGTSGNERMAD